MKILHVVDQMDPVMGGVCQAVRTMIRILEENRIQSEVVSLDDPNASFSSTDIFINHPMGPPKGPWHYSSKLTPWLLSHLQNYDVVIIHGLWLYSSYAAHKAFKISYEKLKVQKEKKDLPYLYVMPHGMLDPYFQKAKGRKIKSIRNWMYWKLIESSVVNKATGLLFTCEEERLLAHQPFSPYFPKKEWVVGLGVEEPPVSTLKMRQSFFQVCPEVENEPYILFISRIHEKKGLDLLIQAYENIIKTQTIENENTDDFKQKKQFPKLVIAGPGLDTSYGIHIQKLVKASTELKSAVIFPGMLRGDEKWGAFYGCDVFILPSHQENFGIAVVEALACGKPVLISNKINIWREIVSGGGCLVGNDTVEGIQEILHRWIQLSNSEKEDMASKALTTYKDYFALKPAASRLIKALEGL